MLAVGPTMPAGILTGSSPEKASLIDPDRDRDTLLETAGEEPELLVSNLDELVPDLPALRPQGELVRNPRVVLSANKIPFCKRLEKLLEPDGPR